MAGTLTVSLIIFPDMYCEVLDEEATYTTAHAAVGGTVDSHHIIESLGPNEQHRAHEAPPGSTATGSTASRSFPVFDEIPKRIGNTKLDL